MEKVILQQYYNELSDLYERFVHKEKDHRVIIEHQRLKLESEMEQIAFKTISVLKSNEELTSLLKIEQMNRLENFRLFSNEMEKYLEDLKTLCK